VQSLYRTVKSVRQRPFGLIFILLERFPPYILDESEIRGDFKDIKSGDVLLLRNGKYQKNVLKVVT
jgi:hypothetical protein